MDGQYIKKAKGWAVRFYLPGEYDANGKPIRPYLSGFATKDDAKRAMIEYLANYNKTGFVPDASTTVRQYLEYWFEQYCGQLAQKHRRDMPA